MEKTVTNKPSNMYVSKKDLESISAVMSMVGNVIENGATDEEYWHGLSNDLGRLFDKAKRSHYKNKK